MSAPKTVVECELRGHTVPCKVCGHIPPDFCGQDILDSQTLAEAAADLEGTDAEEATEEPVSDAPKARKAPLGAASRKRAVTA